MGHRIDELVKDANTIAEMAAEVQRHFKAGDHSGACLVAGQLHYKTAPIEREQDGILDAYRRDGVTP
jgi:hypothetical protein